MCLLVAWVNRVLDDPRGRGLRAKVAVGVLTLVALSLRNNMLEVVAAYVVMLGVAAVRRSVRERLLAVFVPSVMALVAHLCIVVVVYGALGVRTDSQLRESLSVPLQQLARVEVTGGELTKEEHDYIAELIPSYGSYAPLISDAVKASFNTELFQSDPVRFVCVWAQVGLRNPSTYLDSFVANTFRSWYVGASVPQYGGEAYHPYLETRDSEQDPVYESLGIEQHQPGDASVLPWLRDAIREKMDNNLWSRVPVVATVMNTGVQIWWYVIAIAYAWYARTRRGLALALVPVFLYWGTLLLGPVVLTRYLYPLYTCAPLAACVLVGKEE